MAKRSYMIPAARLAAVAAGTTGCLSSLKGTWELVEVDGEDPEDYYAGDYASCVDIEFTIEIDERDGDEYEGEAEQKISIDCYGYTNSFENDGDVEAEQQDKGEYEITIDWDGGNEIELECEIDGDEMDCDQDNGPDLLFEKG